ncbi:MAG TPA: PP2C family serine/threonine-protein phosphatase [Acidimicrobiia bacterium]|nr:PP2C family serine/threonine-protein phosphatase [Acidimicrobiia bacterium]
MKFSWATATDPGRVRDHNEDSVWPEPGHGEAAEPIVVAVADGMGGHAGGEVASRTAIETATTVGGSPVVRVQAANLAVLDAASHRPRLAGMGTTLTLALLESDGHAEMAHVGDSRAYLVREDTLTQITDDHSYVAEMMAAGRMTPAEAEVHPYRSVVTRAVGLETIVDVDTLSFDLAVGDRVLICSDGLTNMLDDPTIGGILSGGGDPKTTAEALVAAANTAGGVDNITVVVVDVM